jgi:hypothetical protein
MHISSFSFCRRVAQILVIETEFGCPTCRSCTWGLWLRFVLSKGRRPSQSATLKNMKNSFLLSTISLLLVLSATATQKNKPTLSKTPSTAEEIEVYGTFLDSFVGKGAEPANFSDKTFPLNLDADNQGPCLEGIQLNNSAEASRTIHVFDASISGGRPINLVDERKHKFKDPGKAIKNGESVDSAVKAGFRAGVLRVSEIVFDEPHRFEVLKFAFYCGSLCSRGGTMVFEKVDGKWKQSNRACSMWIS